MEPQELKPGQEKAQAPSVPGLVLSAQAKAPVMALELHRWPHWTNWAY